jgi:DNA-binding response OmpR family regulator
MTFGIIETEEPLLAELISLAFEAAGHDCVVLKDIDSATRILDALHLDSIVLELPLSDRSGLDWLETVVATRPDLPSRTLLLTQAALASDEAARISALGVEVALRPRSVIDVERVVMERLRRFGAEWAGRRRPGRVHEPRIELVN